MATASANTSAAHVVRGLPLVRHPARPTLCRRASRMGAPTGAAAHRPASTNCCTRMREDSFMLQAALVNTSAFETRLMKEGGKLHILRRHLAWKPSKRRPSRLRVAMQLGRRMSRRKRRKPHICGLCP